MPHDPHDPYARDFDYLFKIVLFGDPGVGKSSLVLRFADDTFTESYISTSGVAFRLRDMNVDGSIIRTQTWDTMGQEQFRIINATQCKGADAVLLVFDMTSKESFDHIEEWSSEIDRYASENVIRILVGTKADLIAEREVAPATAQAFADKLAIPFILTSSLVARNDQKLGADNVFTTASKELIKRTNLAEEKKGPNVIRARLAPPPPETIGIGRRIGNFFEKIWAGLKAIGRGFGDIFSWPFKKLWQGRRNEAGGLQRQLPAVERQIPAAQNNTRAMTTTLSAARDDDAQAITRLEQQLLIAEEDRKRAEDNQKRAEDNQKRAEAELQKTQAQLKKLDEEKKNSGDEPPDEYICPINLTLMEDPVQLPETGQSCERSVAEKLTKNPYTHKPMSGPYTTNIALKALINDWLTAHPNYKQDDKNAEQSQSPRQR